MHELVEKYESLKEELAKISQKKMKLEANVEVSQKKLQEIDDKIREKIGVEPEKLGDWIEEERAKIIKQLEKVEKEKESAKEALSAIEEKLSSSD